MSVILVTNVGVRDLRYNVMYKDNPLFLSFDFKSQENIRDVADVLGCKLGARHIAKKILEKGEEELEKITFPILKPAIQYVLEKERAVQEVILIVTDQDEEKAPAHWPNDTINSGTILKKLIEKHFSKEVEKVQLFPIKEMPASSDKTYEFFRENLPKILPGKPGILYVILSPGIPALKDALKAQALNLYYDVCHICQVIEPKEDDLRKGLQDFPNIKVQEVHIDPLLRGMVLRSIVELIARYDYSGALTTIRKFENKMNWKTDSLNLVKAILSHAHDRFNFAYEEAKKDIQNFIKDRCIQEWYRQVKWAPQNRLIRLKDAIFTVSICIKTRRYAEMLWRIDAFYAMAKKMAEKQKCHDSLKDKFKKLGKIKEVRNQTVHQLIGVSKSDLDKEWSNWQKELVLTMKQIFAGLKGSERYRYANPYEEVNHRIMKLFKNL